MERKRGNKVIEIKKKKKAKKLKKIRCLNEKRTTKKKTDMTCYQIGELSSCECGNIWC